MEWHSVKGIVRFFVALPVRIDDVGVVVVVLRSPAGGRHDGGRTEMPRRFQLPCQYGRQLLVLRDGNGHQQLGLLLPARSPVRLH